jgi:hypothetical protein
MKKDKNLAGGTVTFPFLASFNVYQSALINSKYLPANFRFISEEEALSRYQ